MYSRIYLAILLVLLSCCLSHTNTQFRMINGVPIDISKSPHTVAIYISSNFMCAGSLVTMKSVVTDATCVCKKKESDLEVLGGVTDRTNRDTIGMQTRKVWEIICVDGYTKESGCINVAVLKLDDPFTQTHTVKPVELCDCKLKTGDLLTVNGWGGMDSDYLLERVSVNIKKRDECQHHLASQKTSLAETAICAAYGLENVCFGVGGAGALVRNKLCAVAYNNLHEKDIPSVFTDLTHKNVKDFLNDNINFNE